MAALSKRAWFVFAVGSLVGCGSGQGGATEGPSDSDEVGTATEGLCTKGTLTASPGYAGPPGVSVTWSATVTCAFANPQYKFWYRDTGGTWHVGQDWSTQSTWTWDTTPLPVGLYATQVWVRENGSTAQYEVFSGKNYSVTSGALCTGGTLSASPKNEAVKGATVTLTATSATCTSPQYRFMYLPPGGTWTQARAYGSGSTFAWDTTGLPAGSYSLQAYARDSSSPQPYDTYGSIPYKLTLTPGCTAPTLSATPASPQVRGTSVTFNAGSSTCPAPRYRFLYKPPGGAWVEGQAYSSASSYVWDTTNLTSGTYSLQLWARDSASTNSYDSFIAKNYTLTYTASTVAAPKLSAGLYHTCLVRNDATIDCWGTNNFGQLGDGTTAYKWTGTPVSGIAGATSVGTSYYGSCAVMSDTSVKCWGYNANGQLGDGSAVTQSTTPVTVSGLTGVVALTSGGAAHECALMNNGTAQCWGYNSEGQLGNQSPANKSAVPVVVTGLNGVVQLAAGYYHTCALTSAGVVKCWGANASGQLGNGTTTKSTTPVTVSGIADVRAIAASNTYTCAILFDGSVACWGFNAVNGTSSTPVAVSGVTSATSLSIGASHACAVLSGGGVSCWAVNTYGELGNGGTANSASAVAVSGLTGATATTVASGWHHTCALFGDGTANCWGYGSFGILGNKTTANSLTPVSVILPP